MNFDSCQAISEKQAVSAAPIATCVACKEDIRPGATVCTKCKSPQDWTRHILNWKEVGSALLALVPLWTGAVALWTLAFRQPEAKLRIVLSACEEKSLTLAMVNDGDAHAVLSAPKPKLSRNGKDQPIALVLKPDGTPYPSLLGPKEGKSVTFKPEVAGLLGSLPTRNSEQEVCTLVVETGFQGFKSRPDTASASCPCPAAS